MMRSRLGRKEMTCSTGLSIRERKFHRWNFRSPEPSFPGTFVLTSEINMELSFPNSKIIIFNKLNTLRRRHNLIVYLLMRRPTLMM